MLGDLFGTKGNYELGLLYSSRRKFLVTAGQNSLEPPDEFLTKRQAHRHHLQKVENKTVPAPKGIFDIPSSINKERKEGKDHGPKSSNSGGQQLTNFNSPSKSGDDHGDAKHGESTTDRKKFKKTAKLVMEAVILDHHMDDAARAQWSDEIVAGVHVWINKSTGEVLCDPPWLARKTLVQRSPSRRKVVRVIVPEDRPEPAREAEFGTGSLVYDNKDLEDLFGMLDKVKK